MTTRKLVAYILVILLFGSVLLTGCSSPATPAGEEEAKVEEVKIGVLLPLSGPVAPIGVTSQRGHELAVEEINAAGGIKSLGGAKLKLIFADSRGDAMIGMSEAERLIKNEGVSVIVGAYQSAVTFPSTQVAEQYKVPYVVPSAVKDEITQRGFKYVFRTCPPMAWYTKQQVQFAKEMGEKTGHIPKRVALVYENTDWGQSAGNNWKNDVPEAGMEIVLDAPYPATSSDLTPVVLQIKQADPDLILFTSYTADAILLTNAIAQMNVNSFGMIGGGGGHADPEYMQNTGKNCEYHFDMCEWAPDLGKPGVKETNEKFRAKHGVDLNGESANCYAATYVIADALERAASTDPEKIREALSQTKITSGPAMIMPHEAVEFDESGQNIHAKLIMIQIRDGQRVTVWPFSAKNPDYDAVWPVPEFEKR